MSRILLVVGSLRKNSFNRKLASAVAQKLEGKAEVAELDYSELPFMN